MLAAGEMTGEARWTVEARRAHSWFLGENDAGLSLATPEGDATTASIRRGPASIRARNRRWTGFIRTPRWSCPQESGPRRAI